MKSGTGKMMLSLACAGLVISLMASSALAADARGGRSGGDRRGGGSSSYDRGGRSGGGYSSYDRGDRRGGYSNYDRGGHYSPRYIVRGGHGYYGRSYGGYYSSYYYAPTVVYADSDYYDEPAPVYVAPVVVRSYVAVRPAYRRGFSVGFYYGR